MMQIKLLRDCKYGKKEDIINVSENSASTFLAAGFAEILDTEKEKAEAVQYYRDKHVTERLSSVLNNSGVGKNTAIALGVKPENYDKIRAEMKKAPIDEDTPSDSFKNAANVFNDKISLAEKFNDKQPIYYDRAGMFWLWNTSFKCWEMKDEVDIANMLYLSLGINTVNSRERGEILHALKQVGRMYQPTPLPKTSVQFKNGIIDLTNPVVLLEADPDYFTVNPIPWKLGQTEETPVMDDLLAQWVGVEGRQTLYEILAYCILPDYPIHRLFCLVGEGCNGKGTFLRMLTKFLGEKNCTSTELDTLLNSKFEVTRLYKKLVCQIGETNFNEMSKTSILKKLTGGDMIGFEFKNKNPFEDYNYAKIIISTNSLPTTTDKTMGFYRRWMILDFPNRFSEQEDVLSKIPDAEYENLARKSVHIAGELLQKRKFTNEGSIEERMKRYEDRSDPLERFLEAFTVEDPDGYIWKNEFERKLNQWCVENRHRQFSEVAIGKKMKDKGIQQTQKTADWLTDGTSKLSRCWVGIRWK